MIPCALKLAGIKIVQVLCQGYGRTTDPGTGSGCGTLVDLTSTWKVELTHGLEGPCYDTPSTALVHPLHDPIPSPGRSCGIRQIVGLLSYRVLGSTIALNSSPMKLRAKTVRLRIKQGQRRRIGWLSML